MKKKNFIFYDEQKIFLTRKEKRACPRKTKKFRRRVVGARSDQSIHIAVGSTPDLTELTRARNFSTFGVPWDADQMRARHTKNDGSELHY